MVEFTTTIVGSGSAKPRPGNLTACQVLNYNNTTYLIDCCDGATAELLRMGFSINKIKSIFITHAHGDHCMGLPCLLATMNLNSRTNPLTVYAPEEVFDMLCPVIDKLCSHMNFDVDYKTVSSPFDSTSIIYADNVMNIQAVSLRHGNQETYGYIFSEQLKKRHINMDAVKRYRIPRGAYEWIREHDWEMDDGTIIPNSMLTDDPEPSRSYAYISDTYLFKELSFLINGATTLYCEASFMEQDREFATKWQHCTASDAATLARDTETVKLLIIGHVSARYNSDIMLVDEARKIFPRTSHADKDRIFTIE